MRARISKWGNSLGIRIPVMAAEEMSLSDGEVVELIVRDGEIIIKKQESTLEDLVTQITRDNRHDETDFGTVGRELRWPILRIVGISSGFSSIPKQDTNKPVVAPPSYYLLKRTTRRPDWHLCVQSHVE